MSLEALDNKPDHRAFCALSLQVISPLDVPPCDSVSKLSGTARHCLAECITIYIVLNIHDYHTLKGLTHLAIFFAKYSGFLHHQ